ncbi:hypothetical protein F442_11102 [Phytophthora nicotianae P10297]|uniref:Uncharacterized protein n=1 Tax=Phytophthora nicotianae P10297 TaxID=1317064 RepID=W2Z4E6_PHYNI|nr:hypothetical protein F442_11102 [Phytophthora nicotianae P10297]
MSKRKRQRSTKNTRVQYKQTTETAKNTTRLDTARVPQEKQTQGNRTTKTGQPPQLRLWAQRACPADPKKKIGNQQPQQTGLKTQTSHKPIRTQATQMEQGTHTKHDNQQQKNQKNKQQQKQQQPPSQKQQIHGAKKSRH